jgi:hypothetical protein
LTVVVDADVMQVNCVALPRVNANHEFGGMAISEVVADAPSLQYATFVVPTLKTATTAPVGNVPVELEVVTEMGVPVVAGANPAVVAENEPVTGNGFAVPTLVVPPDELTYDGRTFC